MKRPVALEPIALGDSSPLPTRDPCIPGMEIVMRLRHAKRRGATLMFALLLMVALVAAAAFSVDIGYIVTVQTQLQNAADASALAAVAELKQPYVQYSQPLVSKSAQTTILNNAMSSAIAEAERVAALNQAGSASSLTVLDADVVCGFLDGSNVFHQTPPDSDFPNSVRVTVRRDSQANNPVQTFFAGALGQPSASLSALGQATLYSNVSSFTDNKSVNGTLLPVAFDIRLWQQFLQNGSSGGTQVTKGGNGQPQLQIYPDSAGYGGFGLVSIGPPATDVPSYRTWIDNGPSPSDLSYLISNNLVPVSPSSPQYWAAGPGMKSTLVNDFASVMGQPRLVPLYDGSLPPSGNGYPIVAFAGVTITQATGDGSNMNISVQPMAVSDPTALGGSPAGSSTATFSFSPPCLTK